MPSRLDSEYLSNLKAEAGMTNQEIAAASGVPLGTVGRILSGEAKNPTLLNAADVVSAMGGSLDALVGISAPSMLQAKQRTKECNAESCKAAVDAVVSSYDHAHELEHEAFRQAIRTKNLWLMVIFIYACITTVTLVITSLAN